MQHINKKRWLTFIFVSLVLLTTSCNAKQTIEVLTFEPSNFQVFFYTNKSNPKLENEYLKAILDLKNNYPSQLDNIELTETTIESLKRRSIAEYPALVIVKDGQTISKLSGQASKTDVLKKLKKTVNGEKNSLSAN
ncbi:hypothetical protein [Sediminibacillus albus]|uniref:hypothetical protein n=1 Tax=Sediminibacillus albus TaxID=407036 RepID=UPI000B86B10E|nr:hypothetical protein [Sediminibacillus albus]